MSPAGCVTTVLAPSESCRNYPSASVSSTSLKAASGAGLGTFSPSASYPGFAFNFPCAWRSGAVAGAHRQESERCSSDDLKRRFY